LLCLLPLTYFFGGTVLRIATNKGELVIRSDDPDLEVTVKGPTATVYNKVKDRTFLLTAGDYDVLVEVREKGEVTRFATERFTITRNGTVTFDATLKLVAAAPAAPRKTREEDKTVKPLETLPDKGKEPAAAIVAALDPAWLKRVAELSAEEQLAAVKAELIKRNPDFDGQIDFKVDKDGTLSTLSFATDQIADISPVRALRGLRSLTCKGSGPGKGKLAKLVPLTGMKLFSLHCGNNPIDDLLPLRGIPLTHLTIDGTLISELSPLRGMKLTHLFATRTKLTDLSPVEGMKLQVVTCGETRVTSLAPLRGMKIQTLYCDKTEVSDLSPLAGMSLAALHINDTPVADLSPLKEAKVNNLSCGRTKITDLSPLQNTGIRLLVCPFDFDRDAEVLRGIPTLTIVNGQPAAKLLKISNK
jgi:Leucine-rich repeat (LRR) protein